MRRVRVSRPVVLLLVLLVLAGVVAAGARLHTSGEPSTMRTAWPAAASARGVPRSVPLGKPATTPAGALLASSAGAHHGGDRASAASIVLHLHGNPTDDAGCTGSGSADLIACSGPFLLPSATLGTGPAGHWEPSNPGVDGGNPRTIHDPNWIWNVSAPTAIAGTAMTVKWWGSCGGCGAALTADWNIRLFIDNTTGALTTANVTERVTATPTAPNVAELLTATIQLPATLPTINSTLVLQIDPVYIDLQQNTHVYYDSTLPCPTAASVDPCDSTVTFDASAPPPPPPPPPNPTRTYNQVGFGPATTVDYQRTEGEPLLNNAPDGSNWETGPWGFSTAQSFVHRSVDGGDQFNVVSPIALRPQSPPGGGDSTIVTDDQGYQYFGDLEGALTELDCSVSNDNGNNWRKNPSCVPFTGSDRQWLAVDNGSNHTAGAAGAADNTVFYAYHDVVLNHLLFSSPGSTGATDLVGGLVFTNAGANAGTMMYGGGGNCGKLIFEPVQRNLYYPCGAGNHVDITVAHVNPGQRTGLTFQTFSLPPSPGGTVSNLFPLAAVDSDGDIYIVWSDTGDHNIYYAYSTNGGANWSQAVQVSTAPATSNVFAWAQAGSPGKLVAIWLGNNSTTLSDSMPNWQSDPAAANGFPFFGYVSLISGANTSTPAIDQSQFTEKPMHYGQICNSGIGCTAQVPAGDRTMADFLSVDLGPDGALQIMYNDTTSQHHGAHLYFERQLTGPTAIGTTLSKVAPPSAIVDPASDAQSPHYAPTGAGPNQPALDITAAALNQQDPTHLRFRITVNNLSGFAAPAGKTNAVWIMRFQALSKDDTGAARAYRIFYVGAESVAGGPPTFFAGSPTRDGPPQGCQQTTPGTCKVLQYPQEITANVVGQADTGTNTICITIPTDVFGAAHPISSSPLYNVSAFTAGRNNATTDVYTDVDSTKSFDFQLGQVVNASCGAPTVVELKTFSARRTPRGVVVSWRTASESDVLGFNVYRGSKRINRTLLPARGSLRGASYRFVDRTARGAAYRYRLQTIARDGTRAWSAASRVRATR